MMKKRILGVLLCLCMTLSLLPTAVWAAAESGHTHYLCGDNTCNGSGHETESSKTTFATEIKQVGGTLYIDNEEWTVSNSGNYLLDGGVYYLSSDIKPDALIRLNGSATLCLNGHSITANHEGDVIAAAYGVTFTLTDCKRGGTATDYGKITHANTANGGGVYVTGTFNMYGGSITGNKASSRGGGVCVNGGSFKMFGGSITGNTAAYGGGVCVNGGNSSFTMTGGSITGNVVEDKNGNGGGVYVDNNGSFTMTGGSISGNTATRNFGGGVYVNSGNFEMSGNASITGNTADSSGGGVYMNEKTNFNMSGGTICGNTATRNFGGGVCVYKNGNFNMSGGKIGDNGARAGGGVFVDDASTFTMTGGSITGNNVSGWRAGGGICISDSAKKITVSGNIQITGNMKKGTKNENGKYTGGTTENLYLSAYQNERKTITIGGALADSAKLGVTLAGDYGDNVFTSGWNTYMSGKSLADYFISDVDGKNFALSGGEVKLCDSHTHYLCGGTTCTQAGEHKETGKTTFAKEIRQENGKLYIGDTEWTAGDSYTLRAGAYYLSTDLELNVGIKIRGNVTLCLNGHSITSAVDDNVITVNSDVIFTLTDCKGGNADAAYGKITHTAGKIGRGVYMNRISAFHMYGGSISGNTVTGDASYAANAGGGVHIGGGATFNMYGGSITGNKAPSGGGVYVEQDSHLNMSGTATIDGNTANGESSGETATASYLNGGGVCVASDATFTMTDSASITNNNASGFGGGANIGLRSKFEMSGNASITGNTAKTGGGVFLYGSAFEMQSGTISGNTATGKGGGVFANGKGVTFTMTGGSVTGNNTETNGGGVFVSSGTFTVSGSVNITANVIGGTKDKATGKYTGGTASNVYLNAYQNERKTITIGGALADSAKLGVTLSSDYGDNAFTSGWNTYMSGKTPTDYFTSDVGGYEVKLNGSELKLVSIHVHSWVYTANGDTITATCKNCPDNGGKDYVGGTGTITASDATYNGKVKTATVSKTGIFEDVDMPISYSKYNTTDKQFESTHILPAGAGRYMASITYGGVTASVEYTIGKAEREAPAGLTVSPAGSVDGKGKINGTTTGADNTVLAMEYNTSATATTGWKDCSDGSTEVAPGTYYVRYKETDNYLASEVSIALTVEPHTHSFTETVRDDCLKSAATCQSPAVYYKSCSDCGAKSTETFTSGDIDPNNHANTATLDKKDPTCNEKGYTGDTWCLDCNKKIADGAEMERLSHALQRVEAKAATTKEEGNIEYWRCDGCGKYFADQEGAKEITRAQTVVEKLPEGKPATPKTGDDSRMAIWSLAAILSALGVTIIELKKRRVK